MLAVLVALICIMLVILIVAVRTIFIADKEIDTSLLETKKFFYMFNVMNQWMQAQHAGKRIDRYLRESGYKKIAIYGMHYIGERLLEELAGTEISVAFAIDENRKMSNYNIDIYKPADELPAVDLIVVTTALYFYDIRKKLQEKVECPIISIEELTERMV